MTAPAATARPALTARRCPSTTLVLLVSVAAAGVAALDALAVATALPGGGPQARFAAAHAVAFAAALLPARGAAERLGRRRVLVGGAALLAAAAAGCAVAGPLLALRAAQGAGAAAVVAAALALARVARPARGAAVWAGVALLGAALGAGLGAALGSAGGGRAVFLPGLVLGGAVAVTARRVLVESRSARRRGGRGIAAAGTVALTGLAVLVVSAGPGSGALRAGVVLAACGAVLGALGSRSRAGGGRTDRRTRPAAADPAPPAEPVSPGRPGAPTGLLPPGASIPRNLAGAPTGPAGPTPAEPPATGDPGPLADLPLLRDLDPAVLGRLRAAATDVEVRAGEYLFHAGEVSDALYLVRSGRLEVCQGAEAPVVLTELGRGDVLGELGLITGEPRSASVRAVRDTALTRLARTDFDAVADASVLRVLARGLATRLREIEPPAASRRPPRDAVVAVVALDDAAPVHAVSAALLAAVGATHRAVDPGRVDRDGLDRAERSADKVLLTADTADEPWRALCLRVADRVVLVGAGPEPPAALPARAAGADLVLTGPVATRAQRQAWEERLTPRSAHQVDLADAAALRPLAARLAGRSLGLVLGGGGARAFAHLGVLDELEAAAIPVDRVAGTSVGSVIAAFAATGLDAAAVDAHVYEYFVRTNPIGDLTVPTRGLIRGRRTETGLAAAFGERRVEELPREFRCVSTDLLARRAVVHRRGRVRDAVAASLRLPGLYPPLVHDGTLHVDGGVLDNLPVGTLAGPEGPVVAVSIGFGGSGRRPRSGVPRVPPLGDTLMRTMLMASGTEAERAVALADVVLRPDVSGIGLLAFHEIDRMREAGRAAAREALPAITGLLAGRAGR